MKLLFQLIILTILGFSQTINDELKELSNATPERRVELMNHIKEQLIIMNQQERNETIDKLRAKLQPRSPQLNQHNQVYTNHQMEPKHIPMHNNHQEIHIYQEHMSNVMTNRHNEVVERIQNHNEPVDRTSTIPTNTNRNQPVDRTPTVPTNTNHNQPVDRTPTVPTNTNHNQPVDRTPTVPTNTNHNQPVDRTPTVPTNTNHNQPVDRTPTVPTNTNHNEPVDRTQTVPTNTNRNQPVDRTTTVPTNTNHNQPVNRTPTAPTDTNREQQQDTTSSSGHLNSGRR